MELIVVYLI